MTVPKSRLLERIQQAYAEWDDVSERLAALGADAARITRVVDGEQDPTGLDLVLIAEACRTTVDWLSGGNPPRQAFHEHIDHRYTVAPHDSEAERIATQRAVQMAAESEKADAWFAAQRPGHGPQSPDYVDLTGHLVALTAALSAASDALQLVVNDVRALAHKPADS